MYKGSVKALLPRELATFGELSSRVLSLPRLATCSLEQEIPIWRMVVARQIVCKPPNMRAESRHEDSEWLPDTWWALSGMTAQLQEWEGAQ